jgi:hypothetical protein
MLRILNSPSVIQSSSDGFPVRVDRPAVERLVQRRDERRRPFQRPSHWRLEPVPRRLTMAQATEPSPLKRTVNAGWVADPAVQRLVS